MCTGTPSDVVEVLQESDRRLRVLSVSEIVGNTDAQRDRRHSGPVEPLLQHAHEAGDPLVPGQGQSESGEQAAVGRAADDERRSGVGDGVGDGADGDDDFALRLRGDLEQTLGERGVAQMRLDAGQHHKIVWSSGEAGEAELVGRPADAAHLVIVEFDEGSFLGEIEERIGVDRCHDGRDPVGQQFVDRGRGNFGDVEPAAQGEHHDRPVQRGDIAEVGRQDLGNVHPASASTT